MLKFGGVANVPGASDFILYGAASLRTGALAPSGDKINVGCLAKIEINVQHSAVRVTVRTLHAAATAAIMQTVKNLLL
jgi:hypothetical protein